MIWVVAVVIVSEIVIFVQLMLAFQKRGARLKIARAPILKRIERHQLNRGELAEKVQIRTKESLEPLDAKIAGFTHDTGFAANLVAELDNEAHERAQELGLNANDEDEDEDEEQPANGEKPSAPTRVVKDKPFNPFDRARHIRGNLEVIFEQIGSLRSDEDIVTNMAQRLAASNDKPKG
jgi:hypothetical protein